MYHIEKLTMTGWEYISTWTLESDAEWMVQHTRSAQPHTAYRVRREESDTMHTITLYRDGGSWMADHSDPRIVALFGCRVLPTPYRSTADPNEVVAIIRRRNPECDVRVESW